MKKIVWAINPYSFSSATDANMLEFFKTLKKTIPVEIQPAYVMTSGFSQIMQYFKDLTYENMVRKATEDCTHYLSTFKDIDLLPLQIIENTFALKSAEVSSFISYLKHSKPEYVCLASSGKNRTGQILGSFAESYLRQSDMFTFVMGPNAKANKNIQSALVPLEAMEDTKDFVQNALSKEKLPFLKMIKMFHKITLEDYFARRKNTMDMYEGKGLSKEEMTEIAHKVVTDNFDQLVKVTEIQDVSCIVKSSDETIEESIVNVVKEQNSGLIILKSSTGPFLESFIGSITKDIIHSSPVPVAIYPYKYKMS